MLRNVKAFYWLFIYVKAGKNSERDRIAEHPTNIVNLDSQYSVSNKS